MSQPGRGMYNAVTHLEREDKMDDVKATFNALMEEHKIAVDAVFVPFSQSRNKDAADPSLNWRVTLKRDNWDILTTDYGAGIGHCETVDEKGKPIPFNDARVNAVEAIKAECEDGKARRLDHSNSGYRIRVRRVGDGNKSETWWTMPDPADVLGALLMDGQAIDSGGFEDWAEEMGIDGDSIKAKAMYDACVETGLKLRNALGETLLGELHDAAQDL